MTASERIREARKNGAQDLGWPGQGRVLIDSTPFTIRGFELSRPYVRLLGDGRLFVLVDHCDIGMRAHPATVTS